jgi:poly(A) polymerase
MQQGWLSALEALASLPAAGAAGLFLTGGVVRDLLLRREPRDLDLIAESAGIGSEKAFLHALAALSGMEPVVFDRKEPATFRVVVHGVIVDTSFFAPERIQDALARRDFTINAMAAPLHRVAELLGGAGDAARADEAPALSLDVAELRRTVVDPLGGLADLDARRLALASPAALSDDPLRMLRAVRLAATLDGFTIGDHLAASIRAEAARIAESASERVSAEMEIIFRTPRSGAAIRRMEDLGLLAPILPELDPLRGLRQPARHHDHDAFEHSLRALEETDRLAAGCPELGLGARSTDGALSLKWAALLHDAGKAATATVDAEGTPHFYGHETASAALAEAALRRLRVPQRIAEPVVGLIDLHLRLGALASQMAGDRPIRRVARAAGDRLESLALLALADRRSAGGEEAAAREAALIDVARRALELRGEVAAAAKAPPLLDGREVMEILGLKPGLRVGSVLRWLDRLRADGRIATREEAVSLLKGLPPPRIQD